MCRLAVISDPPHHSMHGESIQWVKVNQKGRVSLNSDIGKRNKYLYCLNC